MVTLGVFAKHWTPGRAKTRLATTIGDTRAAEAARLFLRTAIERLTTVEASRTVAFTPADRKADFAASCRETPWRIAAQPDGSLGDRMRWFFERSFSEGAQIVLIVGADSPDLPLGAVDRAIAWLAQEGPASEPCSPRPTTAATGWWGLSAPPPIFGDIPWGTAEVWGATLRRLAQSDWRRGRDYEEVDRWYDVDTGDDLRALRDRLSRADPAIEPALVGLARDLSALLAD